MEWPRIAVKPGNTKLRALFAITYEPTFCLNFFRTDAITKDVKVSRLVFFVVRRVKRNGYYTDVVR